MGSEQAAGQVKISGVNNRNIRMAAVRKTSGGPGQTAGRREFDMQDRLLEKKDEIRRILMRLEGSRKRLLRPGFLELGLTLGMGQPRILNQLSRKDGISQRELADLCDMDVTTLSRTLDRLEEAGWLERKKHPECRRSFAICLTEEGRKKAAGVRAGFERLDQQICQGFSEEELETLRGFLKRMEENLEEQ